MDNTFEFISNIGPVDAIFGAFLFVTGLNYLLPEKTVKKYKLDSIQKFLAGLAETKGGMSFKKTGMP